MKLSIKIFISVCVYFYCTLSYAGTASCLIQQNIQYSVIAEPIMPVSATATSNLENAFGQYFLTGCTENSIIKMRFKVDSLSDLESGNIVQNGQYVFFKIRSIQSQSSGSAAFNYLIAHAYLAITLSNTINTDRIQISAEAVQSEGINLFNTTEQYQSFTQLNNQFNVGADIVKAQIYLDQLPENNDIIDELLNLNIQLDIGQFLVSLIVVEDKQSISDAISSNMPIIYSQSRLKLSISGIQILKPTCIITDQEVILPSVSVSAFKNGLVMSQLQPFQLQVDCNGYLNRRDFSIKITDNNQISNTNSEGYLFNAIGNDFSNVGVQILNNQHVPVFIGTEQNFLDQKTGNQFSQQFYARYFLKDHEAFVGKVHAQASILLNYK